MFIKRKEYEDLQRDYQHALTANQDLSRQHRIMRREFYISKCILNTLPQSMLATTDTYNVFYAIPHNQKLPDNYYLPDIYEKPIPLCNSFKHEVAYYEYPLITLVRLTNDNNPIRLGTITYDIEKDSWSEEWDAQREYVVDDIKLDIEEDSIKEN